MKKQVIPLSIEYEPSENSFVQGPESKISKQKKSGYHIASGGCGSYNMYKPAKAILFAECDGEKRSFNLKGFLTEYYNRQRVSQNLVDKFRQEFMSNTASKKLVYDTDTCSLQAI